MNRTRSQLRYVGQWPDGLASINQPAELTVAAQRMAEAALAELSKAVKAHFRSVRIPPPAARLTIDRQGDLIGAYLIERAIAALKREQESGE
jgi:hypothetical protein